MLITVGNNLIFFKVVIASVASLILFILVFCLTGIPTSLSQQHPSITGLSVLEILWIGAQSQTVHNYMADVNESLLNNLRRVGMFRICLADIRGSQVINTGSEALLE